MNPHSLDEIIKGVGYRKDGTAPLYNDEYAISLIRSLMLNLLQSEYLYFGDDETFAYYINPVLDRLAQKVEGL